MKRFYHCQRPEIAFSGRKTINQSLRRSNRGASAVLSSVRDLIRFGLFQMKKALPDQKPILKDETIDRMHTETYAKIPDLKALFMLHLTTPDAMRSPHILLLECRTRRNRLTGYVAAIAMDQTFCLPHWIELIQVSKEN